jgi:hypothetical protein
LQQSGHRRLPRWIQLRHLSGGTSRRRPLECMRRWQPLDERHGGHRWFGCHDGNRRDGCHCGARWDGCQVCGRWDECVPGGCRPVCNSQPLGTRTSERVIAARARNLASLAWTGAPRPGWREQISAPRAPGDIPNRALRESLRRRRVWRAALRRTPRQHSG